jgi:cytochrome c oxidase accessory protein FixG
MSRPEGPTLDKLAILDEQGHRKTVHPADVEGHRLQARRIVSTLLMGLFIVLPWVRMGGEPVVKLDIPRRSFHLFGHVFNGQDGFLLFFVLTGIGFTLITVSAMFGRLWCGWACPQTVWLEGLYRRIERVIDGPANERRALEDAPWTTKKVGKRALKWGAWLAISLFLGHTFVAYFVGAYELVGYLTEGPAEHMGAFVGAMGLAGAMMFDMAWFREQTCIVLCPYGRLQSVLTDEDTLVIGYDKQRGEPRGKASDPHNGACVDCRRCVQVCPTGIDIRNGLQLDCIGCGQCADACDTVMVKIGRPKGLVRTDSLRGLRDDQRRFLRPRLAAYAVAGAVGIVVSTTALYTRVPVEANVLRLPGAPYVLDDTGTVTNPLMLHLVNKTGDRLPVVIRVASPADLSSTLPPVVELEPEEQRNLPVVLRAPRGAIAPGTEVVLDVRAGKYEKKPTTKWMGPAAP